MKTILALTSAAILMLAGADVSAAPSADQIGNWSGSIKLTTLQPSGKTSVKATMLVGIAPDGATTVTLGGVEQGNLGVSGSVYGGTEGTFTFADPDVVTIGPNATIGTAHFKGTTLKGSLTGIYFAATGSPAPLLKTTFGKYKLKKQP